MARQLNTPEYDKAFSGSEKKEKALEYALETRKFEIELYWKRATYFWTFIAAALAAYGVIQGSKDIAQKEHLSVLVGVLGLVFSFAWQSVNRGSKLWQENWENHVAMLEDDIIGPLYKTVAGRPRVAAQRSSIKQFLTGPKSYSVSKINQLVSIFVTVVWVLLIWKAIPPFNLTASLDCFLIIVIVLGALTCFAIYKYGQSDPHDHTLDVKLHTCKIAEGENTSSAANVPPNLTGHSLEVCGPQARQKVK